MSFSNKVVIVTGASSGIGAATATLFAREGANVVMVGRNEAKLEAVEETCARVGKRPLVIRADVADDGEVKRIVQTTVEELEQIDVLVNNAGFAKYGSILDGKVLEAYDDTMRVNVRAVINLTKLATPYLLKTKGNIINISSIAALSTSSIPELTPYYVSKAALDQFTRGCALELASSGLRVNSVNPGPVETDFLKNNGVNMNWEQIKDTQPLKRVSTAEEIADLVFYLAGEKARGITGSTFVCDNGNLLKK